MVSSFRLEDKLNDATRFQRYALVYAKHECVCRESTRDIVQVVILDSKEQVHPP
jgi:hypothetical protein